MISHTLATVFAVLIPAALIGGFLRGFTGFGGPLFLLPVLSLFMSPVNAVAVTLWVDLSCNVRMLPDARRCWSREVVIPLIVGTLFGMPVGAYLLLTIDPAAMKRAIAAAVLASAMALFAGLRYRKPVSSSGYGVLGVVSGLVMGATALGVLTPLFLNAGNHTSAQNRANVTVWAFFAALLLLAILTWQGAPDRAQALYIVPLAAAYLAGIVLGQRHYLRASEELVRYTALGLITLMALAGMIL